MSLTVPDIVRLSTAISRETREMLERYAKRTGVKRGRLIEEALRGYLIAREGLPADLLAPSTVQLTPASRRKFVRELRGTKPNAALKRLMKG